MRGVYAIAWLKDGSKQFEYMSKAQVDHVKKKSKTAASGPWKTDYSEMARKTVVHRLGKYLPLSAEAQEVFEAASKAEIGETIREVEGTFLDDNPATAPKPKADRLANQLEADSGETIDGFGDDVPYEGVTEANTETKAS